MTNYNRRNFLKMTAGLFGAAAFPALPAWAAARGRSTSPTIDALVQSGARVMWVAAHPDDEVLVGSLLAWSSLVYQNPLYFLVLTRGDGGACHVPEGCLPDLGTFRGEELKKVVALYHAQLQHESFWNAPLPGSSFPKRHIIAEKWKAYKDPARVCAEAIRRFKPTVLITFDPDFGATGHPEHQLASRFATAGVRMAADPSVVLDELPAYKTDHVYYGLNKAGLIRAFGGGDDGPVSEVWDASQACLPGKACYQVMAEFTKPHRSQAADMGAVREIQWMIKKVWLRRTDPFTEIKDPYEAVL